MLNPEDRLRNSSKPVKRVKETETYKATVIRLQSALQKSPENRFQPQQQALVEFIQKSNFFSQISEHVSAEFAKNIVKKSRVYEFHGKKQIYQKGEKLNIIFLPLLGNIYVKSSNPYKKDHEQACKQLYLPMIRNVRKNVHSKKINLALQKKINHQHIEPKPKPIPHWQELTGLIQLNEEGGLMLGDLERQEYGEDMLIKGEGFFLGIYPILFWQCVNEQYDRRLMQEATYFRSLRCFDIMEDDQLKIFIERIKLMQFSKDEFVFKEGDLSQHLYLLIEGQAKATKRVQLFKEDPNYLYQRTIKSQGSRRHEKPIQLPYANFQGVFNYSPQTHRVELGIISPISVFGEEEASIMSFRETEVQVISPKAQAYRFTLKDMQNSGNGRRIDVSSFLAKLFDSYTKKRIMSRRQNLRSSLELQNRRNMNYFYLDHSSPLKRPQSSRVKVQKINSCICPVELKRAQSEVKPRYHNFNFNEFLERAPSPQQNKDFSLEQSRIAKLTHNSSNIEQQVRAQSRLSARMKGHQHQINVVSPLFDSNYYKKQRKEALRIENKRRMNMIAVAGVRTESKSKKRVS